VIDKKTTIIMLKPDAIASFVPRHVGIALFRAFANHLFEENVFVLDDEMLSHEQNAEMQVNERSCTEIKFQGNIHGIAEDTKKQFAQAIDSLVEENLCIADIIILGVCALGYEVAMVRDYCLKPKDVSRIYNLDESGGCLKKISSRLHEYLDDKSVRILKLSSIHGDYLVQHWKTFVRHFLIIKRLEKFPLVNLIHVCEEDCSYVNNLLISIS